MLRFELQRFAGEKTERATPRRRQEARRKGQVPKSAELTSAVALVTVLMALRAFGSNIWGSWLDMMRTDLQHISTDVFTPDKLSGLMTENLWLLVKLLGPVIGIVMFVGLAVAFAQVGPMFLPNLLLPDFNRIQPIAGLRRIFSVRTTVEALKAVVKLSVFGGVVYASTQSLGGRVSDLMQTEVSVLPSVVGGMVFQLAVEIAVLMLALAFVDFLFQRFEFERSIRMSKQEVKEEHKNQEGDPLVKSKIRQRGRAIALQRMMQEVPKADVVVTNPTHFAVALQYEAARMGAPKVVAKGQDAIALKIREVAQESGVPTVENRPLARTLYANVEIGDEVPADLFKAVAEVLAYVYRLKQQQRG